MVALRLTCTPLYSGRPPRRSRLSAGLLPTRAVCYLPARALLYPLPPRPATYLASYAAFPLLLLLCDDVREERGNEALLERVYQEEGRRDQGDAVAEPLEEALHDAVLGCERAAALHDAAVLELRQVALHARLDRVHRVGDRAGEYGAGECSDGERRVLTLDHLALDQALLDERRDAEHGHREHRLAPDGHRHASGERRRAVLLDEARRRAEYRASEALLLDHTKLPDAARQP
mmetsp:Transcript_78891/g.190733  ORF Transcript_78891/g.190733 Transcript_78891/m.190733 type:complete len:233 (+) Transcript_78891:81-779(+)